MRTLWVEVLRITVAVIEVVQILIPVLGLLLYLKGFGGLLGLFVTFVLWFISMTIGETFKDAINERAERLSEK